MFKFLKDKLKETISKFSKKVDEIAETVEEEPVEEPKKPKPKTQKVELEIPKVEPEKKLEIIEEKPKVEPKEIPEAKSEEQVVAEPKKSIFEKIRKPFVKKEPKVREIIEEKSEKKGILKAVSEKIKKKTLSEKQFNEIFWDLEVVLLENNVAVEVIDRIKEDLKENLVNKPIERRKIKSTIESTLKNTIEDLFDVEKIDLLDKIKNKKPFVICFVGINGSGKTTSIAKVANLLKKNKLKSVIAASDTFRAAAIQQLEVHANKLNIRMIKHDYGADAAAVAFDAIKYAEAHDIDVVLIDTAGRLHSNVNLMDEMIKIKRVSKPDLVIFVGEAITGNDCVEQAKSFDDKIGIDGIILSKADVDEKGGAAISISYVTKKPIMYLGTGQEYDDLIEFNPRIIVESLGLA